MAFSEEIKRQALARASNRCEKCGRAVTMSTSHAHHMTSVDSGGKDILSNCKILCIPCHKDTLTYGRH